MASRMEIAPELIAAGKQAFEETETPQREIAEMMGIAPETLRARAREWGWQRFTRQRRALSMLKSVRAPARNGATLATEQREALALRIQQVVEREMSAVEQLLAREGAGEAGAHADNARALAGIARALREVALLNKPDDATPRHEAEDDPIPRDIDAFREELARRIHAFVDAREDGQDGGGGLPDLGDARADL